jgi:hypothetical protein
MMIVRRSEGAYKLHQALAASMRPQALSKRMMIPWELPGL